MSIELSFIAAKVVETLLWLGQIIHNMSPMRRKDLWVVAKDLGASMTLLCKRADSNAVPIGQGLELKVARAELAQVKLE